MTPARSRRRTPLVWAGRFVAVVVLGAVLLLLPLFPSPGFTRHSVAPDADSVELAAGTRYRAGTVRRVLLGSRYRELWTEPIRVPVLRLDSYAGGLTPVREGGGVQTRTLHLTSADDRRYIFRSLEKENSRLLRHHLGRSLLAWMLNDQTSSSHPASALIAAPLQAAVGLPAPKPQLVLLPAGPALGQFGERFGGLLGILLENPAEYEPVRPEVAEDVRDTDELLPLLDSTSAHQVDARGFLTARLLDFFLNDWDRHEGQWRWAPESTAQGTLWRPIPVDRDQAFSWYDGWLLTLARLRTRKLANFGPKYPGLSGLTHNSKELDQRMLVGLARPAWDSIAAWLRQRLSDSVIVAAVARQPDDYQRLSGPALRDALLLRRDGILRVAAEYYALQARSPVVNVAGPGTVARAEHLAGGVVELNIGGTALGGTPVTWLSRRFDPVETRSLTLRVHGTGPRVQVVGTGPLQVRVVDADGRERPLPSPEP